MFVQPLTDAPALGTSQPDEQALGQATSTSDYAGQTPQDGLDEESPAPAAARSRVTRRRARRIPEARLTVLRAEAEAKREQREQLLNPTPMWQPQPRLTMLPGGLHWSGQGQVPEVGETVQVERAGQQVSAQVTGYFHAEGFLGLVTAYGPKVPAKIRRSLRSEFVFGGQVRQAA